MFKTVRATYDDTPAGDPSEWLRIIREANEIAEEAGEDRVFGRPTHLGKWWAGGFVEEYAEARVILPDEGHEAEGVRITPLTERADRHIRAAVERLG